MPILKPSNKFKFVNYTSGNATPDKYYIGC